jgi:hypothetical protein
VVKTGLRRVWRDATTLQIGVDPGRALVLGGVAGPTAELVTAVDGTRDGEQLRRTARGLGLDTHVADRLLDLLVGAAVVDDAGNWPGELAELSESERARLAPDLASVSLASPGPDAGQQTLRRRRHACVGVVGAGRVGATTANLLAAAGVGHVVVDDAGRCGADDCAPGGLGLPDRGIARAQAARAAIRRASGSTCTSAPQDGTGFDLVVLAPPAALDPGVPAEMMRRDIPHLLASVRETTGVVGPLVVPGATACLRCLDLHRADRDPAWPLIAAQLATHGPGTPACDVVLATVVAGVAALQVLGALDGADPADRWAPSGAWTELPTHNGTVELALPDWRLRRRAWSPHPHCGCHWTV